MEVKSTPGVKTQFKIYFEAQKIDFDPNVSVFSLLIIFLEEYRANTLFLETRQWSAIGRWSDSQR